MVLWGKTSSFPSAASPPPPPPASLPSSPSTISILELPKSESDLDLPAGLGLAAELADIPISPTGWGNSFLPTGSPYTVQGDLRSRKSNLSGVDRKKTNEFGNTKHQNETIPNLLGMCEFQILEISG